MTQTVNQVLDAEAHELSRAEALSAFLGDTTPEDAQTLIDNGDYLVLTDDEADEKAKEYILESLWAFNYSFLQSHSKAIAAIPEKDFQAMQGKLCESFNNAVEAMINDIDYFIDDAIACDGRGHFLASYDFDENERNGFFIYRCN